MKCEAILGAMGCCPASQCLVALVLLSLPLARPFALATRHISTPASTSTPRHLPSLVATSGRPLLPPTLVRAPAAAAAAKPYRRAPIITKQGWQLTVSGIVCGLVLARLAAVRLHLPSLFVWHVGAMAPMLPLGAASIGTVRRRLEKGDPAATAASRRRRMEWLVIRHFLSAAGALYLACVGVASIWMHKASIGRAHLTTPHAWVGAATLGLWGAAYLNAQPHVWRDQIRARRFSPLRNKRWLWSSSTHRRLGTAAFCETLIRPG